MTADRTSSTTRTRRVDPDESEHYDRKKDVADELDHQLAA